MEFATMRARNGVRSGTITSGVAPGRMQLFGLARVSTEWQRHGAKAVTGVSAGRWRKHIPTFASGRLTSIRATRAW